MKRVFAVIAAMLLLLSIGIPAIASSESVPPDISADPDSSFGSWSLQLRSFALLDASDLDITYVSYGISKVSSTSVYVAATTQANQTADSVGGTMYLQKWANDAYSTVRSRSFAAYGTDYDSDSTTMTVDAGYYYRLKTVHKAFLDGVTVTRTSYTSAIWVN